VARSTLGWEMRQAEHALRISSNKPERPPSHHVDQAWRAVAGRELQRCAQGVTHGEADERAPEASNVKRVTSPPYVCDASPAAKANTMPHCSAVSGDRLYPSGVLSRSLAMCSSAASPVKP
jgi:hypothetical protein